MICPNCKKNIQHVHVISDCWQKASVDDKGNLLDYGSVEEVGGTLFYECPECGDVIDKIFINE